MVNGIINMLPKEKVRQDFIFIEAFVDNVRSYMSKYHVNLSDYMQYLSEIEDSLVVTAPEGQNAVTIITIHKAKGLEYKVAMMPFADWNIDIPHKDDFVWVRNIDPKYGAIEPLPINYKQDLNGTDFADAYKEERLLRVIDNMNLIYVALTRAVESLYVWGVSVKASDEKSSKKTESIVPNYMSNILQSVLSDMTEDASDKNVGLVREDEKIEIKYEDKTITCDVMRVTYGQEPNEEKIEGQSSNEVATDQESDPDDLDRLEPYELHNWNSHIRLARQDNGTSEKQTSRIEGIVKHDIMSRIKTLADIDTAVDEANYYSEEDAKKVKAELHEQMKTEPVRSWFDVQESDVLNEETFITVDGDKRPDRVVIDKDRNVTIVDYKFGYNHKEEYKEQVRTYMLIFKKLGYENVRGYLWYYERKEIVEVKI